jgi:hypothetical protein
MPGYPIEAQKNWAGDHVFMEHDYLAITDVSHKTTPVGVVLEQIRAVGAERCVIGTDAGQMALPDPVRALKEFLSRLIEGGLADKEIDIMTRRNPGFLLGIS